MKKVLLGFRSPLWIGMIVASNMWLRENNEMLDEMLKHDTGVRSVLICCIDYSSWTIHANWSSFTTWISLPTLQPNLPILAREDAQDVKELAMFKRKVTKLFYRKVFMTCVIIMIHLGSILPFPCLNSIRPQGMMVRMKMMSSPRVYWLEIRQSWRVHPKFIGKRHSLFHT